MKNLKKIVGIIGLFFIIFFIGSYSKSDGSDEKLLYELIEEIGAEVLEVDMNFEGELNNSYMEIEDISSFGHILKDKMGIIEEFKEESISEENLNQYNIWGKNNTGDTISIIITSYRDENFNETTLFLDMVMSGEWNHIEETILKVEEILKSNGINSKTTTCITGAFCGKLIRNEINDKIRMTIDKINGKIIEDYYNDNLASISVYSPLIDEYILVGNKKMNLNVAMRYNEYEDKTYIWIGTPIITIGY